jgi:hypothetical protein
MQQRVQLAILREVRDQRGVCWSTMAVICPYSDERDYERALELLYNDGAVDAPAERQELRVLAAAGYLTLTETGLQRLSDA